MGYGPQDHFFTHEHGKGFNVPAGEIITFMAPGISFFPCAILDGTDPAEDGHPVRQTTVAFDIFNGQMFQPRHIPLINPQ